MTPDPIESTSSCAVVVHYGDASLTVQACERLIRSRHFQEIAVVANDRLPRPEALIDTTVKWLIPPANLGFAGGCAFAAEQTCADRYAFLNADADLSEDAIHTCLATLADRRIGVVGPVLRLPNGDFNSACGTLTPILRMPRQAPPSSSGLSECVWVTGAALFTRAEVLKVAGMDPSYFLWFEDADYCLRVTRAGYRIVVASEAHGTHLTGATTTGAIWTYYHARNSIWFHQRHFSRASAVLLTAWQLFRTLRIVTADCVRHRPPSFGSHLRGILHAWTLRLPPETAAPGEPLPRQWLPPSSLPASMTGRT